MFQRFTEEARRVIVLAQKECFLRNDPHIGIKSARRSVIR